MAVLAPETSVKMVADGISTVSGDGKSVALKIFMTVVILVVTSMGAIQWCYPFTIDDLERRIELIQKRIEENSTLDLDLLGYSGWEFKQILIRERRRVLEIKDRLTAEPDRCHLRAWLIFRWREMRDVKSCYLSLMSLEREITTVIERQRQYLSASININNATASGGRIAPRAEM
ncbi:hypothetical protein PM082_007531 [Marasmius tenuissimus]|nr:hypothetical protein PM082_007531 [Marasmius tenuissimus]